MAELYTKCPECGGKGRREYKDRVAFAEFNCSALCENCKGEGYLPWEPKAAPLVWVQEGATEWRAFISRNPNIFYTCYKIYGANFRCVFSYRGDSDFWDERGFSTEESAKSGCQAHADGLVKQLVEGNKQ